MFMLREARITWTPGDQPAQRITNPDDIVALAARILPTTDPREHFVAIALDTKHHYIGHQIIAIGTADAVLVHPSVVFRFAILACANFLVLAHNHPSGDPTPSGADKDMTRRLVEAGELMGIRVLDHHVITAAGDHVSLKGTSPDEFGVRPHVVPHVVVRLTY